MPNNRTARSLTATLAIAAALWLTSASASAQTLAGDNGSPLQPYLFGFLFVGGGLIAVLAMRLSDKAVQQEHDRFEADGSRKIYGLPLIGEHLL